MLIHRRFQKMHSKIVQCVLNGGTIFRINVYGFLDHVFDKVVGIIIYL